MEYQKTITKNENLLIIYGEYIATIVNLNLKLHC